ncbi:MAG TPA: hypothetical protein PK908_00885 [Bacteroidales bacterium]|nr:hypothetical protein [Bacteroidales bacterium]
MNDNQKFEIAVTMIGATLLIKSQLANFYSADCETMPSPFGNTGFSLPVTKYNDALNNGLLYLGLVLAVIGSFINTDDTKSISAKVFKHRKEQIILKIQGKIN